MIERILEARDRDMGEITVGRVLPTVGHHFLGPFALLDHMRSTATLAVRPHPHMHLATLTYLFDGEITHRDSLGSLQRIVPHEVNWMSAGSGIAHSERGDAEPRPLHGLQLWVALPTSHEDTRPFFDHHAAGAIPELHDAGATLRVIAGTAFGATSPVRVASPLYYIDAQLAAGARVPVPDASERGAYIIDGTVAIDGQRIGPRKLAVFARGTSPVIAAESTARVILLGGEPLGQRYIWWNFVSSSKDRIVAAAEAWRAGTWAKIPGDSVEFVPAPDGPRFAAD